MESKSKQWVVKTAGVVALALMTAAPTFAQSRGQRDTRGSRNDRGRTEVQQRDNSSSQRTYRDNDRVSARGRVTSFAHERDGYRVRIDGRRESYWVPQSYFRNRGRGPSVGVQIVLGGIFRSGSVYVDDVNWPDDSYGAYGHDNGYVAGTVERVDYRSSMADIRDDRSGRIIRVDLRADSGRRSLDIRDMRRGDYIELSGRWNGSVFQAYNIDAIRDR
jgi:Ni/Co efflux regulator RcnB